MKKLFSGITVLIMLLGTIPAAHAGVRDNVRFPDDAGIIDVTDPFFGAIPDDGVDDTDAIQRVFDLISPNAKIVYFPDGKYNISRQIILEKKGFTTEAEDLPVDGWAVQTEGDRTYLVAEDAGDGPDSAGRITFTFDAIEAERVLVLTHRVLSDQSNSFYYRVNGGEWRLNSRPFQNNTAWRESVVATGIVLETGANTVEIAVRETGFEIDRISLDYLNNYLSNVIVQGQSRNNTILKLQDYASNEDGTPFSDAVIAWEAGVAQFFRTAVRNLTIDVGRGNPEADGLRFHGNNQATVADLRFRSGSDSGDVALDLVHSSAIGPIHVRNIAIHGYNIGIHTGWQTASRTFESIGLYNQREFGWVNEAASTVWIRGLVSRNVVPAFRNTSLRLPGDGQERVALFDSRLRAPAGAEAETAIINFGPSMYIRNVSTPGYGVAVANNNQLSFRGFQGQDGIDGPYIREWWSHGAYNNSGGGLTRLFDDTPDQAFQLPLRKSPDAVWDDPTTWDGPHKHQIVLPSGDVSGFPNDDIDDTLSIQAAIDSGAGTVYLPNGNWTLNGNIELRGNVHRFLGTEAQLLGSDPLSTPKIIIGSDGPQTVHVERLANFGFAGVVPTFEHASSRTAVFSNLTGLTYRPTADRPGIVFINDTVGDSILFKGGQKVYARQLNIEGDTSGPDEELDAKVVNDGAVVWIQGFKTENPGVHIKTMNRGRTELLGNMHSNQFGSETPQYITDNAVFSVVTNIQPVPDAGTTYGTVEETRNGETRTGQISGVGYVAYSNADLWRFRRQIIIDNDHDGATFTGDWQQSVGFPRGFIGENFAFATADAANSATYTPVINRTAFYDVYVRWIADWGGQDHSGHSNNVTYTVNHMNGAVPVTVDQTVYSDGWKFIGQFPFEAGQNGNVVITGDGNASKTINSDGIRLHMRKTISVE